VSDVDLSPTRADAPWLSEEQMAFRASVVRFARSELASDDRDRLERDRSSTFWREGWDACGRFGIQGLPIPEEHGGGGADALTTMVGLEALGYGCLDGGLVFSINAHMWSAEVPLWKHGTPEQQERWLPRLASGEAVGIHAITEPEAGSDAFGLTSRARRDGDGWVIDARKTFISNAPVADVLVIFARTTDGTGPIGITPFIVEGGTPGVQIRHLEKMGLRTSPMGEVVLEGVRVGADAILGREGRGAQVFQTSMDWERALIMSAQLGAMQRTTERTIRYAKERKQFGQPIGKFEAVAFKVADMKMRLDAARALLYRAGWTMDHGGDMVGAAAEAKVFVSEASVQTHLDALQVHGGYGYMTEFEVERALRDALGGTIYSGTSEIQRRLIARQLGL
jgi:alkylation response protein AidB-like acyl-CoA dehydrogenase